MKLWLLVALYFACQGILTLFARFDAFSWLLASPENGASPMEGRLAQSVFSILLFLVPAIVVVNATVQERFGYLRLDRRVKILPIVLAAVAILTSIFFVDVVYAWSKELITDPALVAEDERSNTYTNWLLSMPTIGDLLVCLLVNALIPAVAEEIFFRAGVQQLLGEWIRKPYVAIVLGAAFFSFMHFDATGFIVRFILGLYLGYLFYWSGSLRLSIIAHFIFNAMQIVNSYVVQHYPESAWVKLEPTYTLGAISFVVSVGALLTCRNMLRKESSGPGF
jgi:uncharacterized protein